LCPPLGGPFKGKGEILKKPAGKKKWKKFFKKKGGLKILGGKFIEGHPLNCLGPF